MTGVDRSWYRDFFGETYLEAVALRISPERTEHEVAFVMEALGLEAGARVLDLACGHGRHALELARRGLRVTGLDLSEPSLEVAREVAAREGIALELIHADMREVPFEGELDAVVNLYTAFGYLETEEEDQRVLDGIGRALRPGGVFLLDTINALRIIRDQEPRAWRELDDGTLMLEDRRLDLARGRNEVTWHFIGRDGQRRQLEHSVRLYTVAELHRMLRCAGLEPDGLWGSFDGAPYGLDTWRAIIRARRAPAAR